jgi:enediyne biosynthesis protein E4
MFSNIFGQIFQSVGPTAGTDDKGEGHGVAWGDYDNDNDLDFFVANGHDSNLLYQNNGDGTFSEVGMTAGVASLGNSHGGIWGDYDNDGNIDLYVTNYGYPNLLYHNNGGGTFTEIGTFAAVNDDGVSYVATWGDCDNDGNLDLYVANVDKANLLYYNNGDGTFTEIGSSVGVDYSGSSFSTSWVDFNNDNNIDLFVANHYQPNILYKNNGDGTFTDVSDFAGINFNGDVRGFAWGDYNNDGYLDLFITYYWQSTLLYKNNCDETFTEVSESAGVNYYGACAGVGWGDYNNDGYLDLYLATGPTNSRLYKNNGDCTFTDEGTNSGLDETTNWRGATWGDYDNDGDLDIIVVVSSNANRLYMNNGSDNHWLNLKLVGTTSNNSGIGSKVIVEGANFYQRRDITGGSDYLSQQSLPIEFGLGDNSTIETLKVIWPGGAIQTLKNVNTDQFLIIYENRMPTANAGPDQIKEADQPNSANVPLNGSESSDPDNDPLTYTWRENGNIIVGPTSDPISSVVLSLGTHNIELTVDDGSGGTDTDEVIIEVVDTTPPELTVELDPNILWPPNHKMVNIAATVSVNDICDPNPTWTLVSIKSNEPEEGPGKKNYPDIEGEETGTSDTEFKLRAERLGNENGRIYTITYQVVDASGNVNLAETSVIVPHDMGQPLAYDLNENFKSIALFGNYPNPFNPETEIRFDLPEPANVKLMIFNTLGQKIKTLSEKEFSEGSFTIRWDGTDDFGNQVSGGLYLCRMQTKDYQQTIRMLYLK